MHLDDELCLCFHVSKRKVLNYLRIEKPRSASQLSDCHGAGTGCGWCRSYLKKLFEASLEDRADDDIPLPSAADYAKDRAAYVQSGGGTPPPGATPVE